jgi:hypothetical protein
MPKRDKGHEDEWASPSEPGDPLSCRFYPLHREIASEALVKVGAEKNKGGEREENTDN